MRATFGAALLALALPCAALADPVTVTVAWDYRNFAEPVELFEPGDDARLWSMRSVAKLDDAPVAGPMAGSSFALEPGGRKRFVLVVRNPTGAPLYFFAAPHAIDPVEDALGFKFKCLCVDHAYAVGPGEIWYRVVEFRLDPAFAGHALTATHSIIGIDRARAEAFSKPAGPSDF